MAYQPIVTPDKLTNKMYGEIINEITRDDGGAIAAEAIDTAIQKTKMYLSRFDPIKLFGDQENNIAASFSDTMLTNLVKDIAIWELLNLANPNINYDMARTRYQDAISTLTRIQDGKSDPAWPYLDISTTDTPPSLEVYMISSPKRNNSGFPDRG